jgi:hypothetical protein
MCGRISSLRLSSRKPHASVSGLGMKENREKKRIRPIPTLEASAERVLREREDARVARMETPYELLRREEQRRRAEAEAREAAAREELKAAAKAVAEESAAKKAAQFASEQREREALLREQQAAAVINSASTAHKPPPVQADFMDWDRS